MKQRMIAIILALCLTAALLPCVRVSAAAKDISASTIISGTGFQDFSFLINKDTSIAEKSDEQATIRMENSHGIGSLYLIFYWEHGEYTIINNTTGEQITAGQKEYLHEYVDIAGQFGSTPTDITLCFQREVHLTEIYVFSEGETPGFVQKWNEPHNGNADIVLFSTHGDDEQLFFAGLLPYYAVERDLNVQVVYMTSHRNNSTHRVHEALNGLWAVGVRAYPVFGSFSDFRIDDMEKTYIAYKHLGVSQDDLVSFLVEQIRRFKPIVAVGHDINGEYGHGMHQVYTDCLIKALPITADETYFPDSAEKYGVWDIPKTYLHLYEENPIVIDYDQPMTNFDGMTPFEVTQKLGFPTHMSQQKTWFVDWLYGEENEIRLASQITEYSPCQFGLYRSTVGNDVHKKDFMENVQSRAEQERLEQERLEQERLEQERLDQEQLKQENSSAQPARRKGGIVIFIAILIAGILAGTVYLSRNRRQARRKRRHKRRTNGQNNK